MPGKEDSTSKESDPISEVYRLQGSGPRPSCDGIRFRFERVLADLTSRRAVAVRPACDSLSDIFERVLACASATATPRFGDTGSEHHIERTAAAEHQLFLLQAAQKRCIRDGDAIGVARVARVAAARKAVEEYSSELTEIDLKAERAATKKPVTKKPELSGRV